MNAKAKVAAPAATPEVAAPAVAANPETKPLRLVVLKSDLKFKGARHEWYERLKGLAGKTKEEVMADLEARRPSNYGAKSKHHGKPEPVAGWVRFYERNKYIEFRA